MPQRETPQQHYTRIYNSIKVPTSIPLEMSHQEYKKVRADEVIRLINNGYSEHRAFYKVTGEKLQGKNENKSVPLFLSGAALGGVVLLGTGCVAALQSPVVSQAISSEETMDDISSPTGEKTIIVAGMDTRPDKDQGDGTSQDVPGNRTDALAVVKMDPDSDHIVSIASIPRDTGVTTQSCTNGDSSSVVKINSIYDDYGIDCLEDVVASMTGEVIDGAVAFNFESFSTVIDSLGGVDITTSGPVVDDTLGKIFDTSGTHHVDGRTALNYARARKVEGTAKSDLDRVKRQQKVAEAIVEKIKAASTATQLSTVKDVMTKVLPNTTIDGLSTSDILPLIKLASTLNPQDISSTTIDLIGEDEMGNLIYDENTTHGIFDTIDTSTTTQSTPGDIENYG